MLIAGAGANSTSAYGGALTFDVCNPLSWMGWIFGSAYNFDMLLVGAGAGIPPHIGGALTFNVNDTLSWAYWDSGSAYIYQ